MKPSLERSKPALDSLLRQAFSRGLERQQAAQLTERPDGLFAFLRLFWGSVEAEAFVPGWHLELICAHLEAVSRGEIQTLVINVPPGHTKSDLVSVFWPAWEWAEVDASLRYLTSGHRIDLSTRDAVKMRRLVESEAYRKLYGHLFSLEGDQNAKMRFENTARGARIVAPLESATGERVERVILDDPNSAADVFSPTALERVQRAYSDTFNLRGSDPARFAKVIVMQRLHEQDLSGFVLAQDPDAVHVCLPERFEPERRCETGWGRDPRTERDELLWPARYPGDFLEKQNRVMSSFAVAGQKQQRPAPAEGGVFTRAMIRYWVPKDRPDLARTPIVIPGGDTIMPVVIPVTLEGLRRGEWLETTIQSWDMAEKDKVTSAFTVGEVWGAHGANRYLLDQVRGRWAFSVILEQLENLTMLWPAGTAKYIEEKALGIVTIQTMRDRMSGLIGLEPDGGKIARAYAVEPVFRAGQVFVPHPALFGWVEDWQSEITTFPNSTYADQVDTTSQGLKVLLQHSSMDDDWVTVRRSR